MIMSVGKMKKKKVFGIMMGLIIFITPFMSMNVEQVQSIIGEKELLIDIETITVVNGLGSKSYSLGYAKGDAHTIFDYEFVSEKIINVRLLTEENYQKYCNYESYHYCSLGENVLENSDRFWMSDTSTYHIIFINNNFLKTEVDWDTDFELIKGKISGGYNGIDTDDDLYYDGFYIYYYVGITHYLSIDVLVDVHYRLYLGGILVNEWFDYYFVDSPSDEDLIKYHYFDLEFSERYTVVIDVYYYFGDELYDDSLGIELPLIYPLGYGIENPSFTSTPNNIIYKKPLGLYIGVVLGIFSYVMLVFSIVVLVIRKQRQVTIVRKEEEKKEKSKV